MEDGAGSSGNLREALPSAVGGPTIGAPKLCLLAAASVMVP